MADNNTTGNFDLKGFLNDPKVQADKAGAMKYLQTKGIVGQDGKVDESKIKQTVQGDGFWASIIKDPIKSLLVKPAVRTGQAIGALGIKAAELFMGPETKAKTEAGLQRALSQDVQAPGGFNIEATKPFGEGGGKQIAGETVEAGANIALAGVGGGAAVDVAKGGAENMVKKGIVTGIKTGALFGGAQGLASGLEQNKSTGDIAKGTAEGAVVGAATGGVVGGVGGKIGELLSPPSLDKVTEAISKDRTPLQSTKAGVKNENPSGLSGKIKRVYTDAEKSVAQTVKKIKGYSPSKTFTAQKNAIDQGIKDYATNTVKPFLEKNKVNFHAGDFETYMENNVKPSARFKNNPKAAATYNDVLKKGINLVENSIKDTIKNGETPLTITDFNKVWDSAKAFDQAAEKEGLDTTEGSDARLGVDSAVNDFHTSMRSFIADSLENKGNIESVNRMTDFLSTLKEKGISLDNPEEATKLLEKQFGVTKDSASSAKAAFFKHAMQEFRNMYEASDNLGIKSAKESGTTRYQRFVAKNPKTIKAVGKGVGLGATLIGGDIIGKKTGLLP